MIKVPTTSSNAPHVRSVAVEFLSTAHVFAANGIFVKFPDCSPPVRVVGIPRSTLAVRKNRRDAPLPGMRQGTTEPIPIPDWGSVDPTIGGYLDNQYDFVVQSP